MAEQSRAQRMRGRLETAFAPLTLDIEDESERHRGHAGASQEGETHYRIRIVSAAFAGRTRLDRHRMVNATLAPELAAGLHALAIDAKAPDER